MISQLNKPQHSHTWCEVERTKEKKFFLMLINLKRFCSDEALQETVEQRGAIDFAKLILLSLKTQNCRCR